VEVDRWKNGDSNYYANIFYSLNLPYIFRLRNIILLLIVFLLQLCLMLLFIFIKWIPNR